VFLLSGTFPPQRLTVPPIPLEEPLN